MCLHDYDYTKREESFRESFPYSFYLVFLAWFAIYSTCITDMVCICRTGTGRRTGTGLVIPITTSASASGTANRCRTRTSSSTSCCCKYFGRAKQ